MLCLHLPTRAAATAELSYMSVSTTGIHGISTNVAAGQKIGGLFHIGNGDPVGEELSEYITVPMAGIVMNITHIIALDADIPMSREDGYIAERFVFTEDIPIAIWVRILSEEEELEQLAIEHRVRLVQAVQSRHIERIVHIRLHRAAIIGIERKRQPL